MEKSEQELRAAFDKFVEAGSDYWLALHKFDPRIGAVVWVESPVGLAIFTRGEYRDQLMRNIHDIASPVISIGGTRE